MDIEIIENNLRSQKEELSGRVERTHRHIHGREERVSANYSDQSQELESTELVQALDVEGREEIKLIDAALARILEGSFGACTECGKQVQEARIEALPYTPYCIDCASAISV